MLCVTWDTDVVLRRPACCSSCYSFWNHPWWSVSQCWATWLWFSLTGSHSIVKIWMFLCLIEKYQDRQELSYWPQGPTQRPQAVLGVWKEELERKCLTCWFSFTLLDFILTQACVLSGRHFEELEFNGTWLLMKPSYFNLITCEQTYFGLTLLDALTVLPLLVLLFGSAWLYQPTCSYWMQIIIEDLVNGSNNAQRIWRIHWVLGQCFGWKTQNHVKWIARSIKLIKFFLYNSFLLKFFSLIFF